MKIYSYAAFTGRLILSAIEMDNMIERYTQSLWWKASQDRDKQAKPGRSFEILDYFDYFLVLSTQTLEIFLSLLSLLYNQMSTFQLKIDHNFTTFLKNWFSIKGFCNT